MWPLVTDTHPMATARRMGLLSGLVLGGDVALQATSGLSMLECSKALEAGTYMVNRLLIWTSLVSALGMHKGCSRRTSHQQHHHKLNAVSAIAHISAIPQHQTPCNTTQRLKPAAARNKQEGGGGGRSGPVQISAAAPAGGSLGVCLIAASSNCTAMTVLG